MTFEQVKILSELPAEELTQRLIDFFGEVSKHHDAGQGLAAFNWCDVQCSQDNRLTLSGIPTRPLTDDVRDDNYHDYAAIIYCVCTRQKSSEAMSWDGGRKIKHPVLREIVLTMCGRNNSVHPLVERLRKQYVDEDTFFDGYTTVDEKEAGEAFQKAEKIREQNERQEAWNALSSAGANSRAPRRSWAERIGIFILMALVYGGVKACKASKKIQHDTTERMMHDMRPVHYAPPLHPR